MCEIELDIDDDDWGAGESELFCSEIADVTTDNTIFTRS